MSDENIPSANIIGDPSTTSVEFGEAARILTTSILQRQVEGGRYIFKKELASGGMGQIITIYDQDLRRISAMKVISPALISQEQKLLSFIEEARLTAHLEHPNIIPVHEIGLQGKTGCPYYTMKLVEGESLNNIIYQLTEGNRSYLRDYPRHTLLNIFRKVCDAVAYAHSRGVIHRDIKPENIMVGQFGEVVLMDWGLAKPVDQEDLK